jgi:hypothetical protein
MKIFDRINIIQIFRSHLNTLYDYGALNWNGQREIPIADKITFAISPLVLSLILVLLELRIDNEYLSIIITSLSIFIGLLFSLLTLVFDMVKSSSNLENEIDHKKIVKHTLTQELFINIAFAIALSLVSIVAVFLTRFRPAPIIDLLKNLSYFEYIKEIYIFSTNLFAIYLLILFLFTLLMILKRFYILFLSQFKN